MSADPPKDDPVVLESEEQSSEKSKPSFLATFGILFSGWLVGTLFLVLVMVLIASATHFMQTVTEKIASLQR